MNIGAMYVKSISKLEHVPTCNSWLHGKPCQRLRSEEDLCNTHEDSIWQAALAAITESETTEDASDKLAKFKAAENGVIKNENVQMEAVVEPQAHQHNF